MSISYACSMFGYSRQVYYRTKSKKNKHQKRAEEVISMVRAVRIQMPRLGGKKLYHILESRLKDLGVGRDKLFEILRANHLLIKRKRQYHVTTNSHHRFKKHKNLVSEIEVQRPEQVWVSDITYIGDRETPQYLALITDAYSKKIVGYDVSDSLSTVGSVRALKMAIKSREYKQDSLIHHSDRGIQYCSKAYQHILQKNNLKCSMTEQYDPYENAIAERVNGILKQEFLSGIQIKDLELMRELVGESINIYNQLRPHNSCWLHTPSYMHTQRKVKIKTYKKNE